MTARNIPLRLVTATLVTVARVPAREHLPTDSALACRLLQMHLSDVFHKTIEVLERLATGTSATRPVANGGLKAAVLLPMVLLQSLFVGGSEDEGTGSVKWASLRDGGCYLRVGGRAREPSRCCLKRGAYPARFTRFRRCSVPLKRRSANLHCGAGYRWNALDILEQVSERGKRALLQDVIPGKCILRHSTGICAD